MSTTKVRKKEEETDRKNTQRWRNERKSRMDWRRKRWQERLQLRSWPRQRHLFHERWRRRDRYCWDWRRSLVRLHEEKHSGSNWTMRNAKNPCWVKMHKKMKWRLAMRTASMPQERWARKATECCTGFQHKKKPEPTELLEDQKRDGKMKSTTSSDLARQGRQEATTQETMTHGSK